MNGFALRKIGGCYQGRILYLPLSSQSFPKIVLVLVCLASSGLPGWKKAFDS